MLPRLFQPLSLRGMTARNRIWLSPMCMYSADRTTGDPGQFHVTHYHSRAQGGFGLIITEAAAVTPEGRISPNDVGIWTGEHVDGWREVTKRVHREGSAIVCQLAHAGRKAGTYRGFPGEPTGPVPESDGGWPSLGPSPVAFPGLPEPREMTMEDIDRAVSQFAAAARRAADAHFDGVEIHGAHGYLIHQFLSPLSNQRTDEYGGSFDNRVRFALRVVDAVRETLPHNAALLMRISGTDWADGGWTVEDSTRFAGLAKEHGVDLLDVSSGGTVAGAEIPISPGYQVPLATQVRTGGLPVAAVGLITEPQQAVDIVESEQADAVVIGRMALRDPFWPLRAAAELGVGDAIAWPAQYERGRWR